jgi:hypothetical protein
MAIAVSPPQVQLINTNTNTINNISANITIVNAFGHEVFDESDLKDFIFNLLIQPDLYNSLQEMIKYVHFNPKYPQNMNVYVTDSSTKKVMFKLRGGWRSQCMQTLPKSLSLNSAELMNTWFEKLGKGAFTPSQILRWTDFYRTFHNESKPANQTALTILASEAIVKEFCPEPQIYK